MTPKELKVAQRMMANMLEDRFPGLREATGTDNGFDQLECLTSFFRLNIDQRVTTAFSELERAFQPRQAPQEDPAEQARLQALLAEVKNSGGKK
jgi:hypothetical protein